MQNMTPEQYAARSIRRTCSVVASPAYQGRLFFNKLDRVDEKSPHESKSVDRNNNSNEENKVFLGERKDKKGFTYGFPSKE